MKIFIKNCQLYNCINMHNYDIIINNGIINAVEKSGIMSCSDADKVIDGTNLTAFCGLVDMHCHLREPGYEYKEDILSGTMAAAKGGFTAVACMPNTNPVADTEAVINFIKEKALSGYAAVYPIAAITKGQKGEELAGYGSLKEAGAVALSDDGNPVENPLVMRNAMLYAKSHNMLIISHCEDKQLAGGGVASEGYNATISGLKPIPKAAEEVMVAREAVLAGSTGARVHIAHISTKGSVDLIRDFKSRGINITCETCPHYIAGDDSMILEYDTNAKVNPPLRSSDDVKAITEGLKDGTIDAIATDHAPHHCDDKNVEFNFAANGISGFETAFSLCYTTLVKSGIVTAEKLAELMSYNPAKILGIKNEGIKTGAAANLFLADLNAEYTINSAEFVSKGKNTPFNGRKVYGKILHTITNGQIKVLNGEIYDN